MQLKKWLRSSCDIKHIITIIFTIIYSILSMSLFQDNIVSLSKYQKFLSSRNYNYSVIIDKAIDEDCYAYFGKSITFFDNESLNNVISSLTMMEIHNKHTNNDFLYGYYLSELNEHEVLISSNIASSYKLSIGDNIYSRNETSQGINSYIIKGIIDEIYGISNRDTSKEKGIIILGKNNDYLNNLQIEFIYFYHNDYSKINEQGAHISGNLYNLQDIKKAISLKHILYSLITTIFIVAISLISINLLLKFNINNYLRKKKDGFLKLNAIIKRDLLIYLIFISFLSIFLNYCISNIISNFVAIELYIIFLISMILSCFVSYLLVKRKIKWR